MIKAINKITRVILKIPLLNKYQNLSLDTKIINNNP